MTDLEEQTSNPVSWFYAPTRPKTDTQNLQYEVQDNGAQQGYRLSSVQNSGHCQDTDGLGEFASKFVTMNFTGNYGSTAGGGCDVDLFSRLRLGDENTQRPKGHQQTFSRPWATTPFMSGGAPENLKNDESKLLQSMPVRSRKECSTVSDKFFPNQFDPLIPSLKDEIKNVDNWVQPNYWVRGGEVTRLNRHQTIGD